MTQQELIERIEDGKIESHFVNDEMTSIEMSALTLELEFLLEDLKRKLREGGIRFYDDRKN